MGTPEQKMLPFPEDAALYIHMPREGLEGRGSATNNDRFSRRGHPQFIITHTD